MHHDDVMTHYPQLAAMLYNRPLAIHPDKLVIIERVFREYGAGQRSWPELEAAVKIRDDRAALEKPYQLTQGGTAIIPVMGTLVHRAGFLDALSGFSGYTAIGRRIERAADDGDVRGILLEVDSYGGDVDGLFELAGKITAVHAAGKPIWAYVNESAFSAAYAIAVAAQRIAGPRTAMAGSVGVIALHVDQSKFDERLGVKYTPIYAGKHKNDFTSHEPLSDQARARVQQLVDFHYGVFTGHVAKSRGIDEADVIATEAQIFTMEEALGRDLVDEISGLEETINALEASYSRPAFIQQSTRIGAGGKGMNTILRSAINAALISAEFPAVAEELRAEAREQGRKDGIEAGRAEGRSEGAKAERERIQAVEAQALPGHQALINTLKFDGKTTGPEAAVQILNAERTKTGKTLEQIQADGARLTAVPAAPSASGDRTDPTVQEEGGTYNEAQAKAKFAASPQLQAEFGNEATYLAYAKAASSGLVRVFKGRGK